MNAPPLPILLDADDLLVIAKPAGLPVHPTVDRNRPSVLGILTTWLAAQGDDRHLGLVHRLDADTSGVLLLCRDKGLETDLGRAFAERRIHKTYLAVTMGGAGEPTWTVRNHLRSKKIAGSETMVAVRAGGDRAHTDFALLAGNSDACLVRAQPHTGRKHQIRVHLADSGLPIRGDRMYGDPASAKRLMLHALALDLTEIMDIPPMIAPPPDDMQAIVQLWLGDAGVTALNQAVADVAVQP